MTKVFDLSPAMMERLKASSKSLFNPSPEAAKWMSENRPSLEDIEAMLVEYYLREAPTDGPVH